jgi:coenzyme F420-0:L-glutamate ligase/coenzyme F420-1:gamma-L-glutamate ligase
LNQVKYIPIKVPVRRGRFNLYQIIREAVEEQGAGILDGDILAVSSKFIAMAEGRVVDLELVKASAEAVKLSAAAHIPSSLAELILREADRIYSTLPGFVLTIKHGMVVPNAGIDRSNVERGSAILYPRDPVATAERLRLQILVDLGKRVGVVVTDSRLMPTRVGTTGIAVAAAGFEAVSDERGKTDLFGNIMRVTRRALADDISAGANLLMGETSESIPVVIVRGSGLTIIDRVVDAEDLAIKSDECVFIRGLSQQETTVYI